MPYVFRKIKSTRWNLEEHREKFPWLKEGEAPATTFSDVIRDDVKDHSELSVYITDGSEDDVRRLVTAFALTGDNIDKIDYKLVDLDTMLEQNFVFKPSPGRTPDDVVNGWHHDLQVSAIKLAEFVQLMYSVRSYRMLKSSLKQAIIAGIENEHINLDKIPKERMKQKVQELLHKS